LIWNEDDWLTIDYNENYNSNLSWNKDEKCEGCNRSMRKTFEIKYCLTLNDEIQGKNKIIMNIL